MFNLVICCVWQDVDWEKVSVTLELHQEQGTRVLGFPAGARGIVCNGRVLGPLEADEDFTPDDFALLERFTMSVHVDKIYAALTKKADGKLRLSAIHSKWPEKSGINNYIIDFRH